MLDLSHTMITDSGLAQLRPRNLRCLVLTGLSVSDKGVASLRLGTSLEVLDLDFTGAAISGLDKMANHKSLVSLSANSCDISAHAMIAIGNCSALKELRLGNSRLPVSRLASLVALPGLEILDVRGTNINDRDMAVLGQITSLREINVDNTQVTDRGLNHLGRLNNLGELSWSGSRATSDGVDALARQIPQLNSMQRRASTE
jgi:hypothetical protein